MLYCCLNSFSHVFREFDASHLTNRPASLSWYSSAQLVFGCSPLASAGKCGGDLNPSVKRITPADWIKTGHVSCHTYATHETVWTTTQVSASCFRIRRSALHSLSLRSTTTERSCCRLMARIGRLEEIRL